MNEYNAAGGVVLRGDDVLTLRNKLNGETRLPKGHVESGETWEQTAVREVAEETGYTQLRVCADLGELLNEFTHRETLVRRTERYFLMALDGEGTQPRSKSDTEKFAVHWEPRDSALEELTFESEREFLRRALQAHGNCQHCGGEGTAT